MSRRDGIKPCPFCGDTNVDVQDGYDEVFRHVECFCGARGPTCGTEEHDEEFGDNYAAAARRDAIEAWNVAPRSSPKKLARRLKESGRG